MSVRAVALFALAASLACEDASTPVDPVWGKVACANCAMLVSDPRYASELATDDGARVFFDDPGCMAAWLQEHGGRAHRLWVRTPAGTWVDARSARFSEGHPTPMNFGFAVAEGAAKEWADVQVAAAARREGGT